MTTPEIRSETIPGPSYEEIAAILECKKFTNLGSQRTYKNKVDVVEELNSDHISRINRRLKQATTSGDIIVSQSHYGSADILHQPARLYIIASVKQFKSLIPNNSWDLSKNSFPIPDEISVSIDTDGENLTFLNVLGPKKSKVLEIPFFRKDPDMLPLIYTVSKAHLPTLVLVGNPYDKGILIPRDKNAA